MRIRRRGRWAIACKTWRLLQVPHPMVHPHPPMVSSPSPLPAALTLTALLPMTMTTTSSLIPTILLILHKPKMLLPRPSSVGEYACIFLLSINSSPFAFAFPFQCVLVSFIHFSIWLILQQAAFVLNASRRFRYTLDLKKEEEKEQKKSMIRAHAQVIRVMNYCHKFLNSLLLILFSNPSSILLLGCFAFQNGRWTRTRYNFLQSLFFTTCIHFISIFLKLTKLETSTSTRRYLHN